MTAASTRRHKRRVALGSGQNMRRRTAQNAQSHNTSSNSSGGGPIDLEDTLSQPDRSQQEGSTPTGAAKVSGTRIQTGSDFGVMTRNTGIIVDKTLTCKAFVKRGRAPVCVSLPRRFGKTFNLSTIEEFLNVANSSDTHPVNGQMDEQACHQAHERLFDGTMLKDRVSVVQPVLLQAPSDLPRTQANERKSMLDKLYVGDMRDIRQQFNHALQRLSNASRTMYEATSANIFRTFILLKMMVPLPQGDMDDDSGGDEIGPISINEGQSDKGCFGWIVVFSSCVSHSSSSGFMKLATRPLTTRSERRRRDSSRP
ncbi:hypothetical protein GQ54DRAFT_314777 [Martensiomyces pterosporus]|nr:hypothetical protein GQ54DRAFT_314777 [Martensiomyces pterosporus]